MTWQRLAADTVGTQPCSQGLSPGARYISLHDCVSRFVLPPVCEGGGRAHTDGCRGVSVAASHPPPHRASHDAALQQHPAHHLQHHPDVPQGIISKCGNLHNHVIVVCFAVYCTSDIFLLTTRLLSTEGEAHKPP